METYLTHPHAQFSRTLRPSRDGENLAPVMSSDLCLPWPLKVGLTFRNEQ